MTRTITLGNYVSVQGTFVRQLSDGRIEVQVGDKIFAGTPVTQTASVA
ncbi:hypothetical protein [Pseudooceanicola sp.]|nr:hypothetical protein [Pseudooceanicola sp.]MDF1854996.1 hypothetical protein [Pseudooceanicola sp.]